MKKPTRGVVLSGFYWERLHGKKWRECIRKVKRPKRTEKKRKKEEQLIQQSTSSAGARTRMRGNTRREWINSSNQSGQTLLVLLFSCCCCFCRCRWCRRRCSCLSRVLGGHRGNSLSGRVRERTSFFFLHRLFTGFVQCRKMRGPLVKVHLVHLRAVAKQRTECANEDGWTPHKMRRSARWRPSQAMAN